MGLTRDDASPPRPFWEQEEHGRTDDRLCAGSRDAACRRGCCGCGSGSLCAAAFLQSPGDKLVSETANWFVLLSNGQTGKLHGYPCFPPLRLPSCTSSSRRTLTEAWAIRPWLQRTVVAAIRSMPTRSSTSRATQTRSCSMCALTRIFPSVIRYP